jgi:hypothetical protein
MAQGEASMNPPTTVSGKLPKIAAFVLVTLSFVGWEVPVVGQLQPSGSTPARSTADGIYLYGETPQPNQITKAYVVFQHQKGKVIGAIYSPNSEFDCFTGSQKNNTLDVKSVNASQAKIETAKINLSKLHQVKTVSANEQRIVSLCQQAVESPSTGESLE